MFLLFDIGGTTTRFAISHTGDKLDDVKLFPTNHNFDEAIPQMQQIAEELSKGEKFHAVIGGVRCYDKRTGTLFNSSNFPLWVGEPLLPKMKELWHDVYLENDAVMVGLGEAVYGAGKDNKIVAYVTLSTGVGGCRIVDGKPDPTVYSFEPGNMIVGGLDGKPEYLENIISGSAIEEKYGVGPSELTDQKAWEDIAEQTSIGLNNIAVMWSPNVIVLGGSVPQKLDFSRVNDHLRVHCRIYPEVPKVIKEDLGDEGGLYGALAYLRHLP